MKTTPDNSICSPEFQAILAPLQDENQALKQEAQEWKEKYHHLLEQLRLAKQQRLTALQKRMCFKVNCNLMRQNA
ncbi:MAG: hypothetical protein HYX60_03115 [Legionella longbeachae]|nr:hypothetical protein [Legionella longbeachae]